METSAKRAFTSARTAATDSVRSSVARRWSVVCDRRSVSTWARAGWSGTIEA
jgi:hypothetical protein